jgi:hypothetical protein
MSHSSHTVHGHQPPQTSGVEEDNIDLKAVFGFGIGLAIVTIAAHLLMLWMWKAEVAAVDASNPPMVYPLAAGQEDRRPPIPRLQDGVETFGPKQDLLEFRASEDVILNGYSWVDRNNNIVRIPVADAMKLTTQRGLPTREQGEAPAATPNAATQEKK